MIDVNGILTRLRDERREKKITPDAVPYVDLCNAIMAQVRSELNEMFEQQKISVHNTLNGKSITIK